MEEIENIPDYLHKAVRFLVENAWIFRESNTEFVDRGVLDNIPPTWTNSIAKLTNEEFNQLPSGLIWEDIPSDLRHLLQTAKELTSSPLLIKGTINERNIKGMSPKKSHEIIQLARTINEQCGGVDLLVDLGCGLVRTNNNTLDLL